MITDHWSVSFLFTLLPNIYHKARSLLMTFSQFDSHQKKTKRSPSAWIPSGFRQWVGSNALLQLYQTGGRSWLLWEIEYYDHDQCGIDYHGHDYCGIDYYDYKPANCKSSLFESDFDTWTSMLRFEGGSGAVVIEAGEYFGQIFLYIFVGLCWSTISLLAFVSCWSTLLMPF